MHIVKPAQRSQAVTRAPGAGASSKHRPATIVRAAREPSTFVERAAVPEAEDDEWNGVMNAVARCHANFAPRPAAAPEPPQEHSNVPLSSYFMDFIASDDEVGWEERIHKHHLDSAQGPRPRPRSGRKLIRRRLAPKGATALQQQQQMQLEHMLASGDPQDDEVFSMHRDLLASVEQRAIIPPPSTSADVTAALDALGTQQEGSEPPQQQRGRDPRPSLRRALQAIRLPASRSPSPSPPPPPLIPRPFAIAATSPSVQAEQQGKEEAAEDEQEEGADEMCGDVPCVMLDPELGVVNDPDAFGDPVGRDEVLHQVHGSSFGYRLADDSVDARFTFTNGSSGSNNGGSGSSAQSTSSGI